MDSRIRVLIADDHAIVREGLKQIALSDENITVSGEAGTGDEAIAKIHDQEFDVVVLDLSLPDRSGLDVLSHVRATNPHLSVLILSMEREEEFAMRCLRAGAAGYLEKRSATDQLVTAIKRLALGKRYISAELTESMALHLDRPAVERPHDLLSPREFEVFLMIASGKALRLIADGLGLSVKTIYNHRVHILEKLGMKSTAELIRYAIRRDLVH